MTTNAGPHTSDTRYRPGCTQGTQADELAWATQLETTAPKAAAWTVALDVEGTLISNGVSQFPRAGLRAFFDGLQRLGVRVVFYTMLPRVKVLEIVNTLVAEQHLPAWAREIAWVEWSLKGHKDLRHIAGADLTRTILVDDMPDSIRPDQQIHQLTIPHFEPPFVTADTALTAMLTRIEAHIQGQANTSRRAVGWPCS